MLLNEVNKKEEFMPCKITRNHLYTLFHDNWTNTYNKIISQYSDCEGITPLPQGYKYDNKIYKCMNEAHQMKIRKEYPHLVWPEKGMCKERLLKHVLKTSHSVHVLD